MCYCVTLTLLSQFFLETNYLIVNGNGGFVGNYLYNDFLFKPLNYNKQVSYYFLITSTFVFFLLSVNFNLKWFSTIKRLFTKRKNIETEISPVKSEIFKPQNEAQEVFSLKKSETSDIKVRQFKLPKLDLLDNTKKIKQDKNTRQDINEEFLKNLLDFGVEGKIKK